MPHLIFHSFKASLSVDISYPQVSGSTQSITVALPWANEVFYYAITTLDESNNRAQVSNLVPIYVEELKLFWLRAKLLIHFGFQTFDMTS